MGKRIKDPSLTRTTFSEAVAAGAELLTDWEGLVWAKPISIGLLGNAWWQGSYDNSTWSNTINNDHTYTRVSTDGGVTWLNFQLTSSEESHLPVTIGSPDGGLSVSSDQILTLNPSSAIASGSMSADHFTKLTNLKFDYATNAGGAYELYTGYADVGEDRIHSFRTIAAGLNTTISYSGDTLVISSNTSSTTGQANTGANVGTLGTGFYDGMNGDILNFRNLHTLSDILSITLDDVNNNVQLNVVEANIDHNSLENYDSNEHYDHTAVSILTTEGITGGGDLTATRTLSLDYDGLTPRTVVEGTDIFSFYRPADDTHFSVAYSNLELNIIEVTNTYYVPLTTGVYGINGLTGGGQLSSNVSLGLAINSLPTIAYDSLDYVALYDVSSGSHGKATLANIIGSLAVSISAGNGMNFSTITSTGVVTLGTPSTITESTTNAASGTTHTHAIDLSSFELTDLGDVTNTPTTNYYLQWNGTSWVTSNPAIGASSPGAPVNSIQFNNAGSFGGSSALTYILAEDRIYLNSATATNSGVIFGADTTAPQIYAKKDTTSYFIIDNDTATQDYTHIKTGRLYIGAPDTISADFVHIQDNNTMSYDNALNILNNLDEELFKVTNDGALYAAGLATSVTDNVLYYNSTTGLITYGAKPTTGSGGIVTINTGSTSGLDVNGGNTSSASTILLNQNDNKLTTATAKVTDYIGFYNTTTGQQSKTPIANLPGWFVYVNGVSKEEINGGEIINFVAGTGMSIAYDVSTNALTFATGSSTLEDIAFEFADLTGDAQQYTLDIKATFNYTIQNTILEADSALSGTVSGGATTISFTDVSTLDEISTTSVVTAGNRIYLNITGGHSATTIRGKLVIQRT
jgi:hypothetical protein